MYIKDDYDDCDDDKEPDLSKDGHAEDDNDNDDAHDDEKYDKDDDG